MVLASVLASFAPAGAQAGSCSGRQATSGTTRTVDHRTNITHITGTAGADVIVGTAGRDIINGLGGDDIICGLGGEDVIYGGTGHDVLYGNDQRDELHGGNGHDTIRGNDGNDEIIGGRGDDNIDGGLRNDTITGGPGVDTISGNLGSDTCRNRQTTDITLACESTGGTVTRTPVIPVPAGVTCSQASLVNHYSHRTGTEAAGLGSSQQRLHTLINETRAICGLDPLAFDRGNDNQAQAHSLDMLTAKDAGQAIASWFQHSTRAAELEAQAQLSTSGENISFVFPSLDPVLVHLNLIKSGGHLCNILGPQYDWIGLGMTYFDINTTNGQIVTQIFTGDARVEATSGTLTVRNDFDNSRSGTSNCWS